MKYQQKIRIAQKLWGWISLAVNCIVFTVFLAEKDVSFLKGGIILSVMIVCYGAIKIQADKTKNDFSLTSVVIEYICIYMITFLLAIKLSDYLSLFSLLIAVFISSFIELLVFCVITYWHTIRRLFL